MERDDTKNKLRYRRGVRQINEREPTMRAKTDYELCAMTDELKTRLTQRTQAAKRKPHLMLVPKSGNPLS